MQSRVAAQRHKEIYEKIGRQKVFETNSVNAICVGHEPFQKLGDTKKDRERKKERKKGET